MDPEKQKQILGYFIEEASDHINTIETSLVNLQITLADSELINELFRAAHSIKGGAAMLGITAMQHVAHNLEDSFKILRDNPKSSVDQDLQTLLLSGVDTLKVLLQQIQNPTEADDVASQEILAQSEPLFAQLKQRISNLANHHPEEAKALEIVFRNDIPPQLRNMLQIFKQPDRPTSREQLLSISNKLYQMGEQFELNPWCDLIQAVKLAIHNPNNTFRILAPIVIKEIKQAQEAVLNHRAIAVTPQLKKLALRINTNQEDEVSHIFGTPHEPILKLAKQLGWLNQNQWLTSKHINFSSNAPIGHLPAPTWLSSWETHEDIENQIHQQMLKVDNCHS